MARAIDKDYLLKHKRKVRFFGIGPDDESWGYAVPAEVIEKAPTLPPPNESLTLISMSKELPPDEERVLVYRPCMADSDIGPYSVQWGWSAKKDGSHWAHLPYRRPPEKDETL